MRKKQTLTAVLVGVAVATGAHAACLSDVQVTLTDGAGYLLGGGKGSEVLEHPLNAVVWLVGALQKEAITLDPGDLPSRESFSPLLPPKPGLSVQANCQGLAGAQPVRVTFK